MNSLPFFLLPSFAAVLSFTVDSAGISAQELECRGLKPLLGSTSAYRMRGARCEGLYDSNVGAHSLAAASFTLGRLRFDLKPGVRLQVSAPGQTRAVNLRAVAIPPKTYYRMDARLPAGSAMVWPVADVLLPENLSASRLGIFGWTGTEKSKTLVPVRVTAPGAATASSSPLLTIQASFDAQQVKWRWAQTRDATCLAFGGWRNAIGHAVTASWPITIDLSQLPAGTNCVEAAAQSGASTDWITLELRVELPAR